MLSMKKKDLKQKGLGNKPNAAQPVETEDIEKMWSSGAIGHQNPRSLLHLVWWNNVRHLGMRGFKEQHDCQLTETEQYIEYKERQTKNRLRQNGRESITTKFGGRTLESEIRTGILISVSLPNAPIYLSCFQKAKQSSPCLCWIHNESAIFHAGNNSME